MGFTIPCFLESSQNIVSFWESARVEWLSEFIHLRSAEYYDQARWHMVTWDNTIIYNNLPF